MTMTYEQYDQIDAIRASNLVRMGQSPLHYRDGDGGPDTPSRKMLRAVHAAILQPDVYADEFAVRPDGRTKEGKAWQSQNPGVTGITQKDADEIDRIRDAVYAHPVAGPILQLDGESELTIEWTDAATGLKCKARIDRLTHCGTIIDLKGYGTTDPHSIATRVLNGGAYIQLAHYCDGVRTVQKRDYLRAIIIAYETKRPYDVGVVELLRDDDDGADGLGALSLGITRRAELMRKVAEAAKTGQYPGRMPDMQPLELPALAWGDTGGLIIQEDDNNDNA